MSAAKPVHHVTEESDDDTTNCASNGKHHKKLDKDRFRKDLGDLIPAYTEVAKRLGILHEQSNVSAVNVTQLSSVKKRKK